MEFYFRSCNCRVAFDDVAFIAEQKFNKALLVEEIGIALLMDESNNGFVRSSEIQKRVKQIMSTKEGDAIRKKILDLKIRLRLYLRKETHLIWH